MCGFRKRCCCTAQPATEYCMNCSRAARIFLVPNTCRANHLPPQDMFGHVNADTNQRGLYYLFYAYHGISGGAVLAALVAGDAAIAFEKLSQDQAVADVMQLLRSIFTPQGVDVPEPLQVGGLLLLLVGGGNRVGELDGVRVRLALTDVVLRDWGSPQDWSRCQQ